MKLRLFPRQEDAYSGLFQAAAVLLDLLSDLADPEAKAKRLAELEHEGDRITRTILTRLASTFIARFDRDEMSGCCFRTLLLSCQERPTTPRPSPAARPLFRLVTTGVGGRAGVGD
jgi:hypothetical protein